MPFKTPQKHMKMCSKPRQYGYKSKLRKSELLRMTFTNSVMIPRKDITIKNHEDSTQLKCKANIKPDNAKPFLVPLAYENILKAEVKCLCTISILKWMNHSQWASPKFYCTQGAWDS